MLEDFTLLSLSGFIRVKQYGFLAHFFAIKINKPLTGVSVSASHAERLHPEIVVWCRSKYVEQLPV